MASIVSIQVRIDDNNATEAMGRIENALAQAGVQGDASIKRLGGSLDKLGGHTTTSLDAVRLLSQEFGFRLPRALESMLSRMPAVAAGLGSIVGGLAAVAAAEVFVRMGEDLYDLEQKYVSITAASDKFKKSLEEAAKVDFTNVRSLETLHLRMESASTDAKLDPQIASDMQKRGILGLLSGNPAALADLSIAHQFAESGATGMQNQNTLANMQPDLDHQQRLAAIDEEHAHDEDLQQRKQDAEALRKKQQISAENKMYLNIQEAAYPNPSSVDDGDSVKKHDDAMAQAEADVKKRKRDDEAALERMKALDAEKLNGLQGIALRQQEELNKEREITVELTNQGKAELVGLRVRQMKAQYANEELKRVQELSAHADQEARAATAAGLTGAPRILAERDATLGKIDVDQKAMTEADGSIDPTAEAAFDKERATARAIATQKLTELDDAFTEHTKELIEQRTDAQLGAYGKIDAAAARALDTQNKYYETLYGKSGGNADKAKKEADAEAAIRDAAEDQKKDLAARNRAEDLQYDREAAQAESKLKSDGLLGWGNQYREAIAGINDQEQQRLAKIDEDAKKEGLTWEEVERRRADVTRAANAEIAEQQHQAAEQLAGTLEGLWDNPMQALKNKAKKAMFEVMSDWLLQSKAFQTVFGSAQPGTGGTAGIGAAAMRALGIGGAPSGTAGVISAGTRVPSSSSTIASSSTTDLGTSSTSSPEDFYPSGHGGGSMMGLGIEAAGDASTLAGTFGLTGSQLQAAQSSSSLPADADTGFDGSGGGPEAQASAQSDEQLTAGSGPGAMGYASAGLAAYGGAKGVYDSFEGVGATKSVLDGTMSGMAMGAAIGSIVPGLGTVVGGAVGAVAGAAIAGAGQIMDVGNKHAAAKYYKSTLFPQLEDIRKNYGSGSGDYLSAVSEADRDAAAGMVAMKQKFGGEAATWVNNNYLNKELLYVTGTIERMAKSGAGFSGRQASEYHGGGRIDGFGDLGTTDNEGYIHAMLGEGVVNAPAMAVHGRGVGMMNNGADAADMASHYLALAGGGSRGGNMTVHKHRWTVNTMHQKSFKDFLDHEGGMETINRSANRHASLYAGDSIG